MRRANVPRHPPSLYIDDDWDVIDPRLRAETIAQPSLDVLPFNMDLVATDCTAQVGDLYSVDSELHSS
jgi:hypothetical protein